MIACVIYTIFFDFFKFLLLQLSDSLESLVEELHYLCDQVQYADPIAANPDTLREQMADNNVSGVLFPTDDL